MENSSKNSHELTRMTRIVDWFSLKAVGEADVSFICELMR
jgi:hypothetical protein